MIYTVRNHQTGRTYEISAMCEVSIDVVWLSVKSWFMPGTTVTISSHSGLSQTFIR